MTNINKNLIQKAPDRSDNLKNNPDLKRQEKVNAAINERIYNNNKFNPGVNSKTQIKN